jgi:hypothetical protein
VTGDRRLQRIPVWNFVTIRNIIRAMKLRSMGWAGHAVRILETNSAYRILMKMSEAMGN